MADECSSMEMELDVSEEYLTKTERSGCCPKLAEWIHLHQKQVINGIYRFVFMGIKISCLVLLTQLPDTELQHSNWKTLELVLGLLIITSTGIFMWLQGSNPGRVDENLSRMSHEEHQGLLIHSDSEDSTIPTSIDTEQATVNIHAIEAKEIVTRREIHYRQLKIEKIQLELAQYCSEDAQESEQHEHEEQLVMAEQSMPFCADCGFQPPLRSHHCRACGVCVATFDHHCHIIGTCIGERNHCRFWWFLLFESLELSLVLVIIHTSFHRTPTVYDWFQENALALGAATLLWPLGLMVFSLWGFHTFLMLGNTTSYEIGKGTDDVGYLKGTEECDLPFSHGLVSNVLKFCTPLTTSWTPARWKPVGRINREASSIWDNGWENQYYSCC